MLPGDAAVERAGRAAPLAAIGCGHGSLTFECARGRTFVARARARSPLRLLTPRRHGAAAWAYTSSFGGGLVDGDAIALDIAVAANAIALVTTQASTKVYRSPGGCRQTTRAAVATGGALALVPDPIVCFKGARYEQAMDVQLDPGASLVLVDAFTAGRCAHGERWAFDGYASQLRIARGGSALVRDALVLDPQHGPVPARMGRFDAFATLVILGPAFAEAARTLLDRLARTPTGARGELVEAGSPLADGALVRVAAASAEGLTTWLRSSLLFAAGTFGGDPAAHKA